MYRIICTSIPKHTGQTEYWAQKQHIHVITKSCNVIKGTVNFLNAPCLHVTSKEVVAFITFALL